MNNYRQSPHSPIQTPPCPHCGIPMVKRHGQYGYFWSCQNYPCCPFTLNYPRGKLSSNQQGFLNELLALEKLCKTFIGRLDHTILEDQDNNLTATYYHKFLTDFESELESSKKRFAPYLSQQKYRNSQSSINTICGLVYGKYAQAFYDIGFYSDSLKTVVTSLDLVSSSDMRYEDLITLQRHIQRKIASINKPLTAQSPSVTSPPIPSHPPLPLNPTTAKSPHRFGFMHIILCIGMAAILFLFFTSLYKPYVPPRSAPATTNTTTNHNRYTKSKSSPAYIPSNIAPSGAKPDNGPTVTNKYIGNINTKKFHVSGCRAEQRMNDSNRVPFESRDAAINEGYIPCGICNP